MNYNERLSKIRELCIKRIKQFRGVNDAGREELCRSILDLIYSSKGRVFIGYCDSFIKDYKKTFDYEIREALVRLYLIMTVGDKIRGFKGTKSSENAFEIVMDLKEPTPPRIDGGGDVNSTKGSAGSSAWESKKSKPDSSTKDDKMWNYIHDFFSSICRRLHPRWGVDKKQLDTHAEESLVRSKVDKSLLGSGKVNKFDAHGLIVKENYIDIKKLHLIELIVFIVYDSIKTQKEKGS